MTRTLIGLDSQGVASVKITKGSIDPVTEPDANLASFYYNSKWSADIKLNAIETTLSPASLSTSAVYTPVGSNASTYKKAVADENAGFQRDEYKIFIKSSFFSYMPYSMPLYDIRWRRLSDNRYIEFNRIAINDGDDSSGREPEYYLTFDAGRSAWYQNYTETVSGLASLIGSNPGNGLMYHAYRALLSTTGDSRLYETTAIIWRLPGNSDPLLDAVPKAPIAGQTAVEIKSASLRVAKPGYDVSNALPTQLAFDSSGRPLSIIYADDVSIAPGVSSVDIGFATTPNMLADMFPYTGSVITFPMARERRSLRLDYWFSENSIFFDNKETFAMRVRFLVLANDQEPLSSGANNVLRQFEAGGQNVVQFLRPGAGNPPALRDIVVDSRWPCLQILKEGFITTKTNANRTGIGIYEDSYEVTFDDAGFFPIVKYATFHNTSALGPHVKNPICAITRDYTDGFDYHQGRSTFCQISAGKATFFTHNGNAEREIYRSSTGWQYSFAAAQVLGIRYYILGFPR
ncbi:hypothetical protein JZX87_13885 [Agrobacterium sp. Ap1]|uniref:hypothetical protein n=1 Tax=Agrobacterium sp. Ap1 TaxID=2815337 RepID=UPI001A8E6505|nr:hypothetical protein [Agrobacterium sp. Ap1]MBO0142253.1 hypothetical protein [Agrobacterium sp. Ap1]